MRKDKRAIVVGAGISGATIANVLAKKYNYKVDVYEIQSKPGGACADELTRSSYRQLHGSHIFHTNDEDVWQFLSKYTKWLRYKHRVKTMINAKLYPMPLNIEFLDDAYYKKVDTDLKELSFEQLDKVDKNLSDFIFKIAFEEYSLKQWGEIPDRSVLNRVKALRMTEENRYFTDEHQGIPENGFTKLIENILKDSKRITVFTSSHFAIDELYTAKEQGIPVFYTGSVDELFGYKFGHLPYRTCDFIEHNFKTRRAQEAAVINYPSITFRFTRSHDYSWYIPTKTATVAFEYPKAFDGDISKCYYPINKEENIKLYNDYAAYAKQHFPNLILAGRQGLYKYINMDQAVRSSLDIVNNFIQNDK